MKNWLLKLSIQQPKKVFWLTLLLSLGAASFIPQIEIDTDPENMLPENQIERVYHNEIKQRFNLYDAIVVGAVNEDEGIFNLKSLSALDQLTSGIVDIKGVIAPDLMALSTVDNIGQQKNSDGSSSIRFEWMMKKAPKDQKTADWINQNINRLPLLQNTLVSSDDKASAIYVPIENKDESHRIATEIEQIISELDSNDSYHITGLPVAEDTFGYQMFVQMGISAPLAALMIFILMWLFFRNLKFVAAPMIIAMATVIITMGIMIGMGFTVHIMSSMIPIFLMPIAVVDSIHLMSEFADKYKAGSNKKELIKEVVSHLYKPMLFTSITSAIGFASLMLTPIPPVQVFGAFVAFGIFLAFLLTMLFIPAYLVVLKPESLESLKTTKKETNNRFLQKIGTLSLAKSKLVGLCFMLLVGLSVWGLTKIEINDNPVRWFKSDHKIRVADKVLNKHFAGTYDAYIVLEADLNTQKENLQQLVETIANKELKKKLHEISQTNQAFGTKLNQALILIDDFVFENEIDDEQNKNLVEAVEKIEALKSEAAYFQQPVALKQIEALQQKLQLSGHVGKSNSLADAVKVVNRELRTGEQSDYQIPKSQAAVAQALLQYQSSHRPQDLWHIASKDYSSTVIWLQLKSGDNQDMSLVKDYVSDYIQENPLADGVSLKWAGKTYLNMVWQDEMVAGMFSSLLSAFVVVLLMMIMLFRSVIFGVLAMLPLSITILGIYGVIGWIGKDYDMPIAVLSALTLGLSVDFAIHFLQRFRDIYAENDDFQNTMKLMFTEPANAISRNAIVIALGFTPLLVAPLMPYVTVGFFLASIMAISALVTLMLLPIGLKWFKPLIIKN